MWEINNDKQQGPFEALFFLYLGLCYNRYMNIQILAVCSHLLFIYVIHRLLGSLVAWDKFLRITPENTRQAQVLHLIFSIALGFLVSSFFLSLVQLSLTVRTIVE